MRPTRGYGGGIAASVAPRYGVQILVDRVGGREVPQAQSGPGFTVRQLSARETGM